MQNEAEQKEDFPLAGKPANFPSKDPAVVFNAAEADTAKDKSSSETQMQAVDQQLSHVWMVRNFLKHADESEEDEELAEVHRILYDFMLALGPSLEEGDSSKYLKLARKKFAKFRKSVELFVEIQPEVSGHMNYRMASKSLQIAMLQIESILTD